MTEVVLDDILDHPFKSSTRGGALVEQRRWAGQLGRMDIDPVVIGPHQSELETPVVARLQKSTLTATGQERAILIPVPIEDKAVDAMVRRGVYLPGENCWIGLGIVAPGRYLRLYVVGE